MNGEELESETDFLVEKANGMGKDIEENKEGATTLVRGLSPFKAQVVDQL